MLYNHRADTIAYRRLNFALFGVASPSDLIQHRNASTPFNIGRAIELTGFQWHETTPFYRGLEQTVSRLDTVLAEVLDWTGGQPLLTQRLCKLIQSSDEFIAKGDETEAIENLVRSHIIKNWTAQSHRSTVGSCDSKSCLDRFEFSPPTSPSVGNSPTRVVLKIGTLLRLGRFSHLTSQPASPTVTPGLRSYPRSYRVNPSNDESKSESINRVNR